MSLRRFTHAAPFNYEAHGIYGLAAMTGIIAAGLAANSELFQFRWNPADPDLHAVIQRVRVGASVSTTFFAAGVPAQLDLVKATDWTVAGTGGAAITPAALLKRRTSMVSTSLVAGDARIATTAALGAGTKTLETLAQDQVVAGAPITASLDGTIFPPGTALHAPDVGDGLHPLVLAPGEGFVVRATVPGTGTWSLSVAVDWAETLGYPFGDSRAESAS